MSDSWMDESAASARSIDHCMLDNTHNCQRKLLHAIPFLLHALSFACFKGLPVSTCVHTAKASKFQANKS
jgi:hypothetical protein